ASQTPGEASEVAKRRLVRAAGLFQSVGQNLEMRRVEMAGREEPRVVGRPSQSCDLGNFPGGVEGNDPKRVAEDAAKQVRLRPPPGSRGFALTDCRCRGGQGDGIRLIRRSLVGLSLQMFDKSLVLARDKCPPAAGDGVEQQLARFSVPDEVQHPAGVAAVPLPL